MPLSTTSVGEADLILPHGLLVARFRGFQLIRRVAMSGMFRNRKSTMPIQYYNRLPKDKVSDVTFVLDPLIATCKEEEGLPAASPFIAGPQQQMMHAGS